MEDIEHSIVSIDSSGIEVGDYEVTLEAFDAKSELKMALKTDVIKISVYTELLRP